MYNVLGKTKRTKRMETVKPKDVFIATIGHVKEHPNADALAYVKNWQCVVEERSIPKGR